MTDTGRWREERLLTALSIDKDLLHKRSPLYSTDITEESCCGRDAGMREPKSWLSSSPQSSGDADMCESPHRAETNPDTSAKEPI